MRGLQRRYSLKIAKSGMWNDCTLHDSFAYDGLHEAQAAQPSQMMQIRTYFCSSGPYLQRDTFLAMHVSDKRTMQMKSTDHFVICE